MKRLLQVLLLTVWILSFSSKSLALFITSNATTSGDVSSVTYLYVIDPLSRYLYRGVCPRPHLKKTLANCSDGMDHPRNRVSTVDFFAYFDRTFEPAYKAVIQKRLEKEAALRVLETMDDLGNRLNVTQKRKRWQKLNTRFKKFESIERYKRLISFRKKLEGGLIPHHYEAKPNFEVFYTNPQGKRKQLTDPDQKYYIESTDRAFYDAHKARGGTCRRDIEPYRSLYGGCWNSEKKLVWSDKIQIGLTKVADFEIWDNKISAAKYCNSLTLGGKGPWRLPRIAELEALDETAINEAIDWDPTAAYWAFDDNDHERFQTSVKQLENLIDSTNNFAEHKSRNIWGMVIDHVISGEITTTSFTDRKIAGQLHSLEDNNYAYVPRPKFGDDHLRTIRRTEIQLADAQYSHLYTQTKMYIYHGNLGLFILETDREQARSSEPMEYFSVFADPREDDYNELPDENKVALICVREEQGEM